MKKILLLFLFSFAATITFAQLKENVGIGVRLKLDSTRGYKIPLIADLIPEGAAEKAGLNPGDYILKINDQSTKNIVLPDIVAMIVGEAGTSVKLSIERKGVISNYNILRGKYKYAPSFYESAVKDNNFCNAITKLMNDAAYDFRNTMDTTRKEKNGNYVSKVKIPGAVSTAMRVSFGVYCEIDLGSFSTKDEVNAAGTKFIGDLKVCFPEYYYDASTNNQGNVSVNIGKTYKNGYESPILQLFNFTDEASQMQKLQLRINSGKPTSYYSIDTKEENNSFANSIRTIYNDITNDFGNVKGNKHETKGGVFSSGSTWYEITPVPDGAKICSLSEGGISLGAKNTTCGFYQGTSRTDAVTTYNKVFDKTAAALGTDFVYSSAKSDWDMNLSKNVESVVTFGRKKAKGYESNLPLVVLVFEKYDNDDYGVRMLFYKSGF